MHYRNRGWLWTGLMFAGLSTPAMAQLMVLPGSDPVTIARAGMGVAFGQSLEAAGLNPALLSSLRPQAGCYLSAGLDMQNSQFTLLSNQQPIYSGDSNRFVPGFGAGWRLNERFTLGLVLDRPFSRHNRIEDESSTRFLGKAIDLGTTRLQAQLAWAPNPNWSLGIGAGLARVAFESQVSLRAPIPRYLDQPIGTANPAVGLAETDVRQEGSALVPAWSAGVRWALNPRWTFGAAVQGSLSGKVGLEVAPNSRVPAFFDTDGLSQPLSGALGQGQAMLAQSQGVAGNGDFRLPLKATLGVRQRVNQQFTWEADVQYLDGASMKLPGLPGLSTPVGTVAAARPEDQFRSGWGMGLMGEVTLSKKWTARLGMRFDTEIQPDSQVDTYVSGARSASFSMGFGYKVWGGELSLGYMFRQQKDTDSNRLEGAWSLQGYRTVGTGSRLESMGHLMAIGFKRAF